MWVGLPASSLMASLCLACAIPQRIGRPTALPAWSALAVGAVAGPAWSAALRAVMWEVAGATAKVDRVDSLGFVLLPGAVIGAVLGWGQWRRGFGPIPRPAWVTWTPMLFAAVLLRNPADLSSGFDGGVGLAAVATPGICMIGGYGLSGGGSRWVRALCLVVLAACVPAWALTATTVGGPELSLATPHGVADRPRHHGPSGPSETPRTPRRPACPRYPWWPGQSYR